MPVEFLVSTAFDPQLQRAHRLLHSHPHRCGFGDDRCGILGCLLVPPSRSVRRILTHGMSPYPLKSKSRTLTCIIASEAHCCRPRHHFVHPPACRLRDYPPPGKARQFPPSIRSCTVVAHDGCDHAGTCMSTLVDGVVKAEEK